MKLPQLTEEKKEGRTRKNEAEFTENAVFKVTICSTSEARRVAALGKRIRFVTMEELTEEKRK
jgi:hypothetical protein